MWRIIVVLMIVGLCVHTAAALPGSGTQQDPFRIQSLADFDEFAADPNYWSGFTRLETDVNLAGRTYSTAVIAPDVNNVDYWFQGTAFTGVFDGNDHKIINLTIDGNDYLGLFGYIGEDGQVRNLWLEGGSVSGYEGVGGLVGLNGEGNVSNCYSTGDVTGDVLVGGLLGVNGGSVSNCYSTGDVNGVEEVGGLVGGNGGSITNCYSTGDVSGTGWGVGGLLGVNGGSVSNCYSTGDVNGGWTVGGLVGENGGGGGIPPAPGHIINSYSTSDVNGVAAVGGLVGRNCDDISNCYSTGNVSGDYYVGGLVGINGIPRWSYGIVSNCYSTGDVNGVDEVGGLVGANECGDIERSFWDVQTSGEPNMCGVQDENYATGCDPNFGKTTAEMKTISTFTDANWDFVEIWGIGENQTYPYLRFAPAGDFNYDKKVDFFDLAILASHWLEEK